MNVRPVSSLIACAAMLLSCRQPLRTAASVECSLISKNPGFLEVASRLPGMNLSQKISPAYWSYRLQKDLEESRPSDLYAVDWGRELVSAWSDGKLADLGRLWGRTRASARLPAYIRNIKPNPSQGFIPAAVYAWGIFYNKKKLAELAPTPPRTMKDFVSILDRAKEKGMIPIALGAAFAWPASAWFTYLDLRINGGKEAWERMCGERPLDDPGAREAARTLAAWRDAGYFSPTARTDGMQESLDAVSFGRALFVLMGAFAVERITDFAAVGFMPVPLWETRGTPRGEILGLTGFAVPARAVQQEAALAFVDAYLAAGSPEVSADGFRIPILPGPGAGGGIKAVQVGILSQAKWGVPTQDRIMGAQFVQDSMRIWSDFFSPAAAQSAEALLASLKKALEGQP